MKIKYRITAAAVAATVAVGLAGCTTASDGGTGGDGEVSGTLTGIFSAQFQDTYEAIVAKFEERYPDVDVKFDYQGGDMNQLVMTQLQGGTAPDILTTFPGGVAEDSSDNVIPLAVQGRIAPLDVSWGDDVPAAWESSVAYDGEVYAFPGALQPLAAIYNVGVLDDLGVEPPTTLDEVFELCAAASDAGLYAYAQGLGATPGPQMLTFGQMATLLDGPDPELSAAIGNGDESYAGSAWEDQFQIYLDMFEADCFGEGALGRSREQGFDALAAGQSAGIVDVGAALGIAQAAAADAEFVIAPIPATNDPEETFVVALPGFVTTINAAAKNPVAAQAFLEFLGEPEITNIYAEGFASVPLIPNDEYTAPPELADFAALVAEGRNSPLATIQTEVQNTLNSSIAGMFLGTDTPAGVAEKLDAAVRK